MGHSYSEMYPEVIEREDKLGARRKAIFEKIKNKSLSEFTILDLVLILSLLDVKLKRGSEGMLCDSELKEMEDRFMKER